jgi:hypothetical protein
MVMLRALHTKVKTSTKKMSESWKQPRILDAVLSYVLELVHAPKTRMVATATSCALGELLIRDLPVPTALKYVILFLLVSRVTMHGRMSPTEQLFMSVLRPALLSQSQSLNFTEVVSDLFLSSFSPLLSLFLSLSLITLF